MVSGRGDGLGSRRQLLHIRRGQEQIAADAFRHDLIEIVDRRVRSCLLCRTRSPASSAANGIFDAPSTAQPRTEKPNVEYSYFVPGSCSSGSFLKMASESSIVK